MEKSPLHQIILHFQASLSALHITVPLRQIEHWALLVHNAMVGIYRKFHTPQHILDVCAPLTNPLQTLAALFHDVVYYQVDGDMPPQTHHLLLPYIEIRSPQEFYLPPSHKLPDHPEFLLLCDIFGFKPGQRLHFAQGLNEFLSAWLAWQELASSLPLNYRLAIASFIEATIPFRTADAAGNTPFVQLARRLRHINLDYGLQLTELEIVEMVKLAVEMANADVRNFAEENTGRFLDNTWILIFESSKILSNLEGFAYSICKYRQGVMRSERFIRELHAERIFHQYEHVPDDAQYHALQHQAEYNLGIATEYLGVKLLTLSILEALAMTTGGDVPMGLFTGGLPMPNQILERAEDYLPALPTHAHYHPLVNELLEFGRPTDTGLDLRNSPLSTFIYKSLGTARCMELLEIARQLFDNQIDYTSFLAQIDAPVLSAIAQACARVSITRQEELAKYF